MRHSRSGRCAKTECLTKQLIVCVLIKTDTSVLILIVKIYILCRNLSHGCRCRRRRQKLTVALISKEQIYEQENIHARKCNRGRCVPNRIGNRHLHQPDMGCSDRGVNRNRQHCGGGGVQPVRQGGMTMACGKKSSAGKGGKK